ncbi:MAG: RNA polymerase sigma factor [Peptococcaceae bacterium]|nr:RNA polymerase sigma factor [Peptococcaceae bacterium]
MAPEISFAELYEQLLPVVYRFVSVRIPRNDIEDVAAEILAKAWQAYPGYQGNSSVKTWALSIAYRHIADYYRALKRTPPVLPLDGSLAAEREKDDSETWLTRLSVGQALSRLSTPQVAAIQLRIVEGYSAAEAAVILGVSQMAVDSLLYRAKKSFRTSYQTPAGGEQHG